MHILATTSSSLDDLIEPVDLNQPRSDVVILSFSASDLAGLEQAWQRAGSAVPALSVANLSELRHPMSVDLWIEKTAGHARVILIRILGGAERWRYGVDQLAIVARRRGIKLLLLPGECSERDEKLEAASTVDRQMLASVLSFFREGGQENMSRLAAGLTVLREVLDQELPQRALEHEKNIRKTIAAWHHPAITEVRGKGLLLGVGLNPGALKTPEGDGASIHLSRQLATAGLLSPPAGPDTVRLMPPLTVSTAEINEALEIFRQTLTRVCA